MRNDLRHFKYILNRFTIILLIFSSTLIAREKTSELTGSPGIYSPDTMETGSKQKQLVQQDWANLKKYAAENERLKAAPASERKVVFMGNSITESWKTIDSSFFADHPYVNRGISGQTTSQMLLRFRQDVIDLDPEMVVILAGINDIAENTGPITLENVFGNIVSMVELGQANRIRVVLCSVLPAIDFPWRHGLEPAQKVVKLNDLIESYAEKNGIVYVDYYSAMVNEEKGLRAEYTNDGVHPTLEGYKVMEPLVQEGIEKAFKRK